MKKVHNVGPSRVAKFSDEESDVSDDDLAVPLSTIALLIEPDAVSVNRSHYVWSREDKEGNV